MSKTSEPLPFAIAHRGGNEVFHENTIEAFEDAIKQGFKRLETDVHFTETGELLAVHGAMSNSRDGGPRRNNYVHIAGKPVLIKTIKPADRIAFARSDFYIPTLEEVLEIDKTVHWNIDTKKPEAVDPLLDALRKHNAFTRVTLASFSKKSTDKLRAGSPNGTSSALTKSEFIKLYLASLNSRKKIQLPANSRAQVPIQLGVIKIITPAFLKAAKRHGIPVDVWTINDPSIMQRLIDAGVDGIFTDKLRVLNQVLKGNKA